MTLPVKTFPFPQSSTPKTERLTPCSQNAGFQLSHHLLGKLDLNAGRSAVDLNQPDRRMNLPDSFHRHMQYRQHADFQT
jgi:hypothetical protein